MAAVPNLALVSVEDYLETSYEPECEYIDGVLEPKTMAGYKHGKLQFALMTVIESQKERFGYDACQEFRIRIGERRFRVPDISVLPAPPASEDYADVPPLLTVEIISKNDRWDKVIAKVRDHHEMGVPTAIIVDPRWRVVFVIGQDGLMRQVPDPLIVSIEMPSSGNLEIDFGALFRQLDSDAAAGKPAE